MTVSHITTQQPLDEKMSRTPSTPSLVKGDVDIKHVESVSDIEAGVRDIDDGWDKAFVKKTIRKADLRLIPMLSAMYCISLIDRSNLSIARSANGKVMNKQLHLDQGSHYSIATLVFFIAYIVLEVPSQLGLRRFGAKWWLGSATTLWGAVMIGMGFVNTWQQLAGLRAILGAFESALYPGAAFLIACWYPRKQMATRNAFFYIGSKIISGLGNIMSWGMSQLHMKAGIEGWRWIFILQGVLTVCIGLAGYIFITDFPDKAKYLTDEERKLILTRIERDRGDSVPDKLTKAKALAYLLDFKIWLFALFFGSTTLGTYGMSYFLPVILESMGFTNAMSQLLTAPPYVFTIFPALATAYLADRYNARAYTIMFNSLMLMTGTLIYSQVPIQYKAARYFGTFLAVGFSNSNCPLIVSWAQTSIRSQSKRGFASAMVIAFGGVGGILAGVAFREQEAKKGYPTGIFLTVAMQIATTAGCLFLVFYFKWQNRKADRDGTELEGSTEFRYQT